MPKMEWRDHWMHLDHRYALIDPPEHPTFDLYSAISAALQEDAGDLGDITTISTVPEGTQANATFIAKADGVMAGLYVASSVFKMVDESVVLKWMVNDGDTVQKGQTLGVLTGPARAILVGERVALNYMQRMSGIATQTAAMAKAVGCCTRATVLDTRKTVPGLRLLDKWAVKIGGGENHRIGLYDMMMIKDNHIAAAGGIRQAIEAAEAFMRSSNIQRPLEVETRTLDELKETLNVFDGDKDTMVTRIMLDNMTKKNDLGEIDVSMLDEAMAMIGDRKVETEASGNVTIESIRQIAKTGVQYISCGALTHSVTALDISLNIETQ